MRVGGVLWRSSWGSVAEASGASRDVGSGGGRRAEMKEEAEGSPLSPRDGGFCPGKGHVATRGSGGT